jgi:hypothetical protein
MKTHARYAAAALFAALCAGPAAAEDAGVDPLLQEVWLVERKEAVPDLSRLDAEQRRMVEEAQQVMTEFLRRVEGAIWGRGESPRELLSPDLRQQFDSDGALLQAFVHGEGVASYRIFGFTVDRNRETIQFSFFLRQEMEGNDFIEQRGMSLTRVPGGGWTITGL